MSTSENNSKRPTLSDVALRSGVSKAAASQILSGKGRISARTRETVMRTAAEMGYERDPHAQRLSRGRYDRLIALLSFGLDMGTATLKMSLIQSMVIRMGYQISMHAYGFSPIEDVPGSADLARQACLLRPRALILNCGHFGDATLAEIREFIATGGVVVSYDYQIPLECDQVVLDRAYGANLAMAHLSDHGHVRIGAHFGRKQPRDSRFASVRYSAYCGSLLRAGVERDPRWLLYSEQTYEDAGRDVAAQYLALDPQIRPTAMIIQNDRTASAFVNALVRRGLSVPRDLSVISDDDLSAAEACIVPLTAITHPCSEIAEQVVQMLASRLQNPDGDLRTASIRGRIEFRDSVSSPGR